MIIKNVQQLNFNINLFIHVYIQHRKIDITIVIEYRVQIVCLIKLKVVKFRLNCCQQ